MPEKTADNFISPAAADRLIAAHDGDVALLYIYVTRTGRTELEQAARDLCRTMQELASAQEKLRRMGLMPGTVPLNAPARAASPERSFSPPAEEMPQYLAEDIVRRSREDGAFAVIVDEAAKVVGRSLSSSDMKLLFGVYDYLALPPEVILVLLNFCAQSYAEKYGPSRRPTPRAIEKEAYIWANQEIMTLEQAEAYIHSYKARRGEMGRVKAALGIRERELSATEGKYIAAWLDMGFEEEAISIAYDRTVTNTGSLKWSYMNKILQSWHENGIHSPEEIEAKDSRRRKSAPPASPAASKPISMDELRSVLDKI